MDILVSLHGRRFGLSKDGSIVQNDGTAQRITPASRLVNQTSATLTATKDLHAGRTVTLNRAAGITVTLPAATGTGDEYNFFVGTTFTGNGIIKVANSTDIMQGAVAMTTDAAGVTIPTAADSDTLTMSGTTTGGIKGSSIKLVDVASGLWQVTGFIISTGAEATPFSAGV